MAEAELDPWVRIVRWPFAVIVPFVVLGLWFNDWLTRADPRTGWLMIGERLIPLTDSARGRGVPFPWEDPAQLPGSWRS
jgi:hypothetical protein